MRSFYSFCLAIGVLLFTGSGLSAQDAYLTGLDIPRYTKAGVGYPITVRARNSSSTAYTFFQVSWRLDGGEIHTMNQPVGGGGIVAGNFLEVTHPVQMTATQGEHVLQVWITVAGETNPSNDTLTVSFTALNNWATKVVLLELRTETWCPVCPAANALTDELRQDPAYSIAKFHMSDGFEFPDGVEYYSQYYAPNKNFTPAAVIELGEYGEYANNAASNLWSAQMALRAAGASPVQVDMNSILDNSTRELTVTLEATFTYALNGPFKMNVYLIEDLIPGTQAGAEPDYIHNALMRAMLGGSDGLSGIIPDSPVLGSTYSHTFSYTVPLEYELANLDLIGIIEHAPGQGSRYALNTINSYHAPVGIIDQERIDQLNAFPNPFEDVVMIEAPGMSGTVRMQLLSLDGRSIIRRDMVLDGNGRAVLDVGNGVSEGVYLLSISDSRSTITKKVSRVNH